MYNGIEYIEATYILENAPIYSKDCMNTNDLIKKKEWKYYLFMRFINDKWEISNDDTDKVFIPKTILTTISELNHEITIYVKVHDVMKEIKNMTLYNILVCIILFTILNIMIVIKNKMLKKK